MIYNTYIKNNKFFVDRAKSDTEIVTDIFNFSMKLGVFAGSGVYSNNQTYKISNEQFKELYTGANLTTLEFNNHFKLREYKKENPTKLLFGDIDPIYHCITINYPEKMPVFNPRFFTLDIEVYAKDGFPDPFKAEYVMDLVTICDYQNKKYYTWGLKPFENESEYDIQYTYCKTEMLLIESLIEFIQDNNIKCFTGWNTEGFDVLYIINRMMKFSHKSFTIKEYVDENCNVYGRKKSFKTIQVIDYMEIYKKFKAYKMERYSLDFVSTHEGFDGKKKSEFSLCDLSDHHWYDYVLYNIIDNKCIIQLEDKLKYVKQAFSMANDNKCLPTDVYSPVKMWDSAVYYELYKKRNILVPPKLEEPKRKLLGGYVGIPVAGEHLYLSVFDISSSYPHQDMMYNISPETLISEKKLHPDLLNIREKFTPTILDMDLCTDIQFKNEWGGFKSNQKAIGKTANDSTIDELNIFRVKFNVIRFSKMKPEDFETYTRLLIKHNVTMTVNLQFYRKDVDGIFPQLFTKYFAVRNIAKQNEKILSHNIKEMKKQIGIYDKEDLKLNSFDDYEDEEIDEETGEEIKDAEEILSDVV